MHPFRHAQILLQILLLLRETERQPLRKHSMMAMAHHSFGIRRV
jgi:hypothetical protein